MPWNSCLRFTVRRDHICVPSTSGRRLDSRVWTLWAFVDACFSFSGLNIWETGCRSHGKCLFDCKNWPMFSTGAELFGGPVSCSGGPMAHHLWRTAGCFHCTVSLRFRLRPWPCPGGAPAPPHPTHNGLDSCPADGAVTGFRYLPRTGLGS